jgi:23S rRNA (pseudouridine1915-N3)-methyltransferase
MQINLLCVGKLKERFYREACAEYQKRMGRYHRLTVTELPDEKPLSGSSEAVQRVMAKEGDRLLPHLQKGFSVALCVEGEAPDSLTLARQLQGYERLGQPVNFVIGGSWGLDPRVIAACSARLSLSNLTLPHNLARLVLLEQLYRASKIAAGETYHK